MTVKLLSWLLVCIAAVLPAGCDAQFPGPAKDPRVWSLSVSADGRYVATAHADRNIVLWDIKTKTKKSISTNGNIYSTYFVKGRNLFLWQDLNDVVHLTGLDGRDKKTWKHFPTYGHVISSNLSHYFSSDKDWNIYHGYGTSLRPVKKDGDSPSFLGSGKLLNMTFSPDEKQLLSVGLGYEFDQRYPVDYQPAVSDKMRWSYLSGVVIWDVASLNPLAKLSGNIAKTYATFSPDGKYVVSGDEGGRVIVWDAQKTKELFRLGSLFHGVIANPNESWENWVYDKTGLIPYPKDYSGQAVLSLKFIDLDNHYLRITANQHYAILYAIDNPLPLKYLDLGTDPYPATREYARNTAIDSAPAAGILVTGQANGPGINVYRYDKTTRTLKRIWVAR